MSDREGGSAPDSTWVKGEAGVLPRGVAARARARLEEERGGARPRPAGGSPATGGTPLGESRPTENGTGRQPASRDARDLGTLVVGAGLPAAEQGAPFLPGPVFAGPYHAAGDPDATPHLYGRISNPVFEAYERALGTLDRGTSIVFASGMAAATAVLQRLLGPGDLLVAPDDGYPGVTAIARDHLATRGVGVRLVPTDDETVRRAAKGASLVWLESPANPGLGVLDLEATIDACRQAGSRVVVDNTLATPLRQCPLDLGADLVVSSDSKHLTGHSDLVLGHVSTRDPELAEEIRAWRTLTGSVPGPFETWLAHRSLATLDVRLERQEAVAAAVIAALAERDVEARYPGFGSVLAFDLGDQARANAFLANLDVVLEATSFGGVHSTAERRERLGDGQSPPGYVRFSAGIESPQDVADDVLRALGRLA